MPSCIIFILDHFLNFLIATSSGNILSTHPPINIYVCSHVRFYLQITSIKNLCLSKRNHITLSPWTTRNISKIYKTMVSRHWSTGHVGLSVLREETLMWALQLPGVSLTELRRWELEIREPGQLECARHKTRKRATAERKRDWRKKRKRKGGWGLTSSGNLHKVPPQSLAEC